MSIWGDSEADRRRYRGRKAKGQPGAFTTGTAERERIGATRRSITGKAGGTERGATWDLYQRRGRRKQVQPGKPGTLRKPATPEGIGSEGKPERRSPAQPKGRGRWRNHRNRTPAQPTDRGRGNPEPKSRRGGTIKECGQPALDQQAW